MSRLSRRIREREAAIGADRRKMAAAVTGLRSGMRRRMSRPSTLCAAFGGGLVLGWVRGGGRAPSRTAPSAGLSQATSSSRGVPMATRLAREVLWPLGVGALRAQLSRLLTEDDAQPDGDTQRR